MKKLFTLLLLTIFITSCSNDDSNDNSTPVLPNNSGYCEINVAGQTYRHEFNEGESFSYVGVVDNCSDVNNLTMQNVEQFETSSFSLDLSFMHDEFKSDFQGFDTNLTVIKPDWEIGTCANNFDFIANYYDEVNDEYLIFNPSSNNQHGIENISVYSENNEEVVYAVKGNFNVTYKKSNSSLIPVSGNYKFFIYVIK
jgi:hypothetical protein